MLTSGARETLRDVRWVIVDEIHAIAGTKRGAHLALSLERLDAISKQPPQRIGLSATQRPLDEIARFLGGRTADGPRPVTVVDAGVRKELDLEVIVPIEDMGALGARIEETPGTPLDGEARSSIWPHVHPRILEQIRDHRTTLIFCNNRRLAERLAARLNELAGEELVKAHHGSLAREQRLLVEDELKTGRLRALVATSSLELGIDMGTVDLVIQVESPGAVSRGLQRIGRAGHQVGEPSTGKIFPKYRGDLLEVAVVVERMRSGAIESTRIVRNPLDVLAQQIVAMCAVDEWNVDDLAAAVRGAANFAELGDDSFTAVLDLLAGRYPSDEFAGLRPRIVWDRLRGTVRARDGAGRIAITNGGTIPDRGLFGVFLPEGTRVGELDEEMVYESRPGETFVLGASTWRIDQITHDRVIVLPAPGEQGKMPFWHGDQPGPARSSSAGPSARSPATCAPGPPTTPSRTCSAETALDELAAAQPRRLPRRAGRGHRRDPRRPHHRHRALPRRARRLAHLRAHAVRRAGARAVGHGAAQRARRAARRRRAGAVERRRHRAAPARRGRALPRRGPRARPRAGGGPRRRRAAGLVAVRRPVPRGRGPGAAAAQAPAGRAHPAVAAAPEGGRPARGRGRPPELPDHPRDHPRVPPGRVRPPVARRVLRDLRSRKIRMVTVDTPKASPFAQSLLYSWIATFMYEGDAPLAERRAAALALDRDLLRELLGTEELRELLDADALAELELELQRLTPAMQERIRGADDVVDLLRDLGDLSEAELAARVPAPVLAGRSPSCAATRRVIDIAVAGEPRVDRGRGRVGLPRRARCRAATRAARRVHRVARHAAGGPRRPLRPDPRPVHHRDVAVRFGLGAERLGDALAGARRHRPRHAGRVPARRHRARVVRRRRAAPDPAPQPRPPPPRGRAGRSRGPGPVPARAGTAWTHPATAPTRCSTRSRSSRARRCRRRRSRSTCSRRASAATGPTCSTS